MPNQTPKMECVCLAYVIKKIAENFLLVYHKSELLGYKVKANCIMVSTRQHVVYSKLFPQTSNMFNVGTESMGLTVVCWDESADDDDVDVVDIDVDIDDREGPMGKVRP